MAIPVRFRLEERLRRARRRAVLRRLGGGLGARHLGDGAFSTGVAIGRTKVLKVAGARDETAFWFGRWVRRYPNPHWPRIYRQIQVGRSHVATWMERLHPLDRGSEERVSCVDDFLINAGSCPNAWCMSGPW
jgi:hypothetical protein